MHLPSVLFVCNHNSARSQMAEAILRHLASDRFRAFSAGIGRKEIKPTVKIVMEETGISLDGQYGKTLEEIADQAPFDYAVIVCKADEDQCPGFVRDAQNRLRWEVESPFPGKSPSDMTEEERFSHYRSLRDQLQSQIEQWLETIPQSTFQTL